MIELGIDLEHKCNGMTPIQSVVYYYYQSVTSQSKERELNLFRCLLEGGAKLDGMGLSRRSELFSVLSEIKRYPEIQAIVKDVCPNYLNDEK